MKPIDVLTLWVIVIVSMIVIVFLRISGGLREPETDDFQKDLEATTLLMRMKQ
jgi:hypothetical protein